MATRDKSYIFFHVKIYLLDGRQIYHDSIGASNDCSEVRYPDQSHRCFERDWNDNEHKVLCISHWLGVKWLEWRERCCYFFRFS